jgi:glycine/D-amino acid oxidase-like deaminating enzyme/nitrite reductase/ring-hydroxylating ferredoxin subunit
MTARTTAHLASDSDDSFAAFIDRRGLELARLFYESHAAAIGRIEQIQHEENIACNFRRLDGFLFPAISSDPAELDAELEAARRVGMAIEDWRGGLLFKGQDRARCLRYPGQAAFHPLRYLRGLAQALEAPQTRIYAHSPVETVEENDSGVVVRTTEGHSLRAAAAVVATNSPINDRYAIHTKQAPYRSYAMAFTIPRGTLPDALYWDTLDPYHYVRLQPGPGRTDYLVVGGADHKTGEANDAWVRFEGLESWIRGLVPDLGRETHRWSGQVLEPIDYSGFIGRNPGSTNVYVATGDSGQGLTHGALAGLLIADLITLGNSPWQELYEPSRIPVAAAVDFIAENATAIKNFAEYVAPGELSSIEELQPGQGAIVREGLKKIAAYRDEDGTIHRLSAACTHLGCHLHWNALEVCWDCPCHGSHFAVDGSVLNAPAIYGLAPVDAKTKAPEKV